MPERFFNLVAQMVNNQVYKIKKNQVHRLKKRQNFDGNQTG